MLTEELCHSEVLLAASVRWKPEAQEAGSIASWLIRVWWLWGAQAPLLIHSGGIFPFRPLWDVPPYPLAAADRAGGGQPEGPWGKGPGGELFSPSSAFAAPGKCRSPAPSGLKTQVPSSAPLTSMQLLLVLSCQGKKTTTGVKLMLSPFLQHYCNILFSPTASRGLGCCARADCFTFWDLVLCSHIKRFVCFKKACAVIVKECIKSGVNKLNWCEGLIGFGGRGADLPPAELRKEAWELGFAGESSRVVSWGVWVKSSAEGWKEKCN